MRTYLLIHGIKHYINQYLFQCLISTFYSMQYNGSSSLISCEKQTIRIEFLSLQGKPKHTTCHGTLSPHMSTVSIDSRSRPGLTALAYNAPLTSAAVVQ